MIATRRVNPEHGPKMARPDTGLSEKVTTPLTPEMVTAIDDFRFDNRKGSRSEAIRDLLHIALETLGKDVPKFEKTKPHIRPESRPEASD
jgi:hypothetical protein